MNKKIFIKYVAVAGLLTITFSGIAFAENGSSVNASTTRKSIKGVIENIKSGLKTQVQTDRLEKASTSPKDRGELKGDTEKMRQDIKTAQANIKAVQMAKVVWIRINATIVRLEKLLSKLDSRIAKIKTAGGNTAVAETNSADAKVALTKAQTDVDTVKTIISSISGTTPIDGTATSTIKTASKDAEIQIKTAQSGIEKALKSLQGLRVELKDNTASSTKSEETN